MISREYIYSVIKDNHVIAVHMKGEDRIDGQSELIYITELSQVNIYQLACL